MQNSFWRDLAEHGHPDCLPVQVWHGRHDIRNGISLPTSTFISSSSFTLLPNENMSFMIWVSPLQYHYDVYYQAVHKVWEETSIQRWLSVRFGNALTGAKGTLREYSNWTPDRITNTDWTIFIVISEKRACVACRHGKAEFTDRLQVAQHMKRVRNCIMKSIFCVSWRIKMSESVLKTVFCRLTRSISKTSKWTISMCSRGRFMTTPSSNASSPYEYLKIHH